VLHTLLVRASRSPILDSKTGGSKKSDGKMSGLQNAVGIVGGKGGSKSGGKGSSEAKPVSTKVLFKKYKRAMRTQDVGRELEVYT
jgi:hypothetical protein